MPNNLPLNWCMKSFKDSFVSISPTYKIKQKEYKDSGSYPIIDQGESFIGGYTDSTEGLIYDVPLIAFGDHTRRFKYIDFPFIAGADGLKVYKPIYTEIKFSYYQCLSLDFPNRGYSRHNAFLQKCDFKIPPFAEQERIVEKIEALFQDIDEGVERLKLAQAQIKQYRQSVLKSAFEGKLYKTTDWKEVPLKKVCEFKSGNTIDTKLEKSSGSIPYIKVGDMNLSENSISIVTSSRFVDMVDIKQNQLIPTGSVIFPKRGGAIATNKKRKVIKPIIIDLNTMAIIPSDKLYTDFFYFWILKIDLMKLSNGGNIPQINNYSFDKVNIPLPTLLEQQRIVEEIEKRFLVADELEKAVNEGLEKADKLKQSILKKAFEGKLAPQNPNDEPASVLLDRIKASKQPQSKGKKK